MSRKDDAAPQVIVTSLPPQIDASAPTWREQIENLPALTYLPRHCNRDDIAGHDVSSAVSQTTAIGIVLSGTRVEVLVPGSPAQVCGMVDTGDELLMVDGQKVTEQTALAALRGSDVPGSVVSLLVRKSGR